MTLAGITYCTVKEACDDLKICRNTLMKLAKQAGAIRRIGARVLIEMVAIYEYLEKQGDEENG